MSQENGGRIALFDNVKGAAIVLVVVGHFVERSVQYRSGSHLARTILAFIYLFHMPVFIFCSGLFAGKSWRKTRRAPTDKFLLYLLLYLIFQAAVELVYKAVGAAGDVNLFSVSGAPWFLLALAMMMLFVPLLGSLPAAPVLAASVLTAVGAGILLTSNSILSLLRFFTYFPYFAAGFYFTPERVQHCVEAVRQRLKPVSTMVAATLTLLALALALYVGCSDGVLTNIKRLSSGLNLFSAVADSTGLAIWQVAVLRALEYPVVLGVIALLFLAVPTRRCPLSALGERSLQVYLAHILILYASDELGLIELAVSSNPCWLLCVVIFSILLAALLAAPRFPQRWINKLGAWLKKIVSQGEERGLGAEEAEAQSATATQGTAACRAHAAPAADSWKKG